MLLCSRPLVHRYCSKQWDMSCNVSCEGMSVVLGWWWRLQLNVFSCLFQWSIIWVYEYLWCTVALFMTSKLFVVCTQVLRRNVFFVCFSSFYPPVLRLFFVVDYVGSAPCLFQCISNFGVELHCLCSTNCSFICGRCSDLMLFFVSGKI